MGYDKAVKKSGLLLLTCLLVVIPTSSAKPLVGSNVIRKYHTTQSVDQVFSGLMKAISIDHYEIKNVNKDQGFVQADKKSTLDKVEYSALFISFSKTDEGTDIEATFVRQPGFFGPGSPDKWANKFEKKLKVYLPDLSVSK